MECVLNYVEEEINKAVNDLATDPLRQEYIEQGEFLALDSFLSQVVINRLLEEVEKVRSRLNRNYIPNHKKGGSVSYYILRQHTPGFLYLYRSQPFRDILSRIAGVPLMLCPEDDPHACALYFYTEPGDHIGFHYDTSYYKGARYTVLIGLVDRSVSRLVCRLHTKDSTRETKELSLATNPGSLIFFNGDMLHHAVTPLGEQEERIVLTLQYVTNQDMGRVQRWFSNLKDAVGYFGLSALWRKPSS